MATTTSLKYTAYATTGLAFTALNGLSTTDGLDTWVSNFVDNTTSLYVDILIGGVIKVGTSPGASQNVSIFVAGNYDSADDTAIGGGIGTGIDESVDGDSVMDDLGADAEGLTSNMRLIETITTVDTDTSDLIYHFGPVSVGSAFGGIVPEKFVIVVQNTTAAALNASGNEIGYIGINYTSA